MSSSWEDIHLPWSSTPMTSAALDDAEVIGTACWSAAAVLDVVFCAERCLTGIFFFFRWWKLSLSDWVCFLFFLARSSGSYTVLSLKAADSGFVRLLIRASGDNLVSMMMADVQLLHPDWFLYYYRVMDKSIAAKQNNHKGTDQSVLTSCVIKLHQIVCGPGDLWDFFFRPSFAHRRNDLNQTTPIRTTGPSSVSFCRVLLVADWDGQAKPRTLNKKKSRTCVCPSWGRATKIVQDPTFAACPAACGVLLHRTRGGCR